ncbi:MAG: hypothetical protein ACLFPA_05960 [Dichotomicrobium sp.]
MRRVRAESSTSRTGLLSGFGQIVLLAVAALAFADISRASDDSKLLKTAPLPIPGYLEGVTDPTFGTEFVRVTDPKRAFLPGVVCGRKACRHRYSSTQAWNADQSLLLIVKGCPGLCFLDGRTYEPLFVRQVTDSHDCKWHPRDADIMVCVYPSGVSSWNPRTRTWKKLWRSQDYDALVFGPYKGNLSADGGMIALRGLDAEEKLVAFALDLRAGKKYPDIPLDGLEGENHYATISPTGRYVYVAQMTADGHEPAYVFTIHGKQVQHWPKHHRPGHGDMTIDADGRDVYVGISKSEPDKYNVIKRRLADGAVTSLIPYGNASHVSARNIRLPGWVFVTFSGSYAHTAKLDYPAPYYQEVVALRIDGSGEIRRLAHTYGADGEYLGESHASPSPDGSRVIWASNWGTPGGPVSAFVTTWTPPAFASRISEAR